MLIPVTNQFAIGAAGGGAFSPADIAGLAAWYDASDAASITESGGAVSQWNDLSGNGYHLTQSTSTQKPTTGSHTMNGLNVLDFSSDGKDRMAPSSNPLSGASAGTMFYVAQGDGITRPGSCAAPVNGPGGGQDSWYPFSGSRYEWFGTNSRKSWSAAGPNDAYFIDPHYICVRAASGAFDEWRNGTSTYSTGTNTVSFTSSLIVGYNGDGDSATVLDIAEIILYDSALSTSDREAVEAYLAAKWGI